MPKNRHGVQEVAGSNPVIPTEGKRLKKPDQKRSGFFSTYLLQYLILTKTSILGKFIIKYTLPQ